MIINKVQSYWTEEDRQRIDQIKAEQAEIINAFAAEHKKTGKAEISAKQLEHYGELEDKINDIEGEVEARYIKASSKKTVLADVEEIVAAIEKKDFIDLLQERAKQLAALRSTGANEDSLGILKEYAKENYANCCRFILYHLRVQLNALDGDEAAHDKAIAAVEKRVALWYIKPHPEYVTMAHGKATDALAYMSTRNAKVDDITGNATIDKFGVQLVIFKLRELQTTAGIGVDKLLSTAIHVFTEQNDFRHANTKEPRRDVSIPLKDYAQMLGYDVIEHETSTPEEAAREKKRAKNQLDNARKAIKKDLLTLQASALSWEEPIKGKNRDFDSISLVTRVRITNGIIKIYFTPEIASYLAERNLITQYPTKLLRISAQKPTAYYIGRKLAEHYNLDNNIIRGTNDRIGIPAILAVTDLPSYEYVQQTDRGHWVERIKEPLERALDTLTEEGILKDWKYTHAKDVELTEEEAYNITSYEDFEKLYLHFTPADKVDHTERIAAKQEARAAAKEKAATRKKKKAAGKKNS